MIKKIGIFTVFLMTIFVFTNLTFNADETKKIELEKVNSVEKAKDSTNPTIAPINEMQTKNSIYGIDISSSSNSIKNEKNAGSFEIFFPNDGAAIYNTEGPTISQLSQFDMPENGVIKSEKGQVVVDNGKIISMDSGIISTLGGVKNVVYIYPTVEDAKNKTNGIPVDGAAEDGIYMETTVKDGATYIKAYIAGTLGYFSLDDVQLIPSEYAKAITHYENVNGIWTLFVATDPLVSKNYEKFPLGDAIEGSVEGEKYYELKDGTFYNELPESGVISEKSISGQTYFQNLPIRSTSTYSANQYKNFLSYQGYTNSQYYNQTNAFVEAQNIYGVNSLMLFSMANHEGAYGTSFYSKKCNNFFGRGAFDSDPDQACEKYGFSDPRSGILAQATFLSSNYADAYDWRYAGSYVGDKAGGINVYYASDVNWGSKIASLAYQADSYLGGRDNSRFRIVQMIKEVPIYRDSALKTPITYMYGAGNTVPYKTVRHAIDKADAHTVANPNFVVIDETSSALKIQVDVPVSNTTTSSFHWYEANNGAYPNWDGYKNEHVSAGDASPFVNYDSMSKFQFWVPKSSGGTTYKVINDVKAVNTSSASHTTYYDTGELKCEYIDDSNGNLNYSACYTQSGEVLNYYKYFSNTKYSSEIGNNPETKAQYIFNVDSNNYLTNAKEVSTSGVILHWFEYYPGTTFLGGFNTHIKYAFDIDSSGYLYRARGYQNNSTTLINYFTYYPNTVYGSAHSNHLKEYYNVSDGQYLVNAERYLDNKGPVSEYLTYYPKTLFDNRDSHIKTESIIDESGNIIKTKEYSTSNILTKESYYYPNTKYTSAYSSHIENIYSLNADGSLKYSQNYKNGQKIISKYDDYYPNTILDGNESLHIKETYDVDSNGFITESNGYKNNSATLQSTSTYYPNTTYDNHLTQLRYKFYYTDPSTKELNYAEGYERNTGNKVNIFTYYPGTIYGSQGNRINLIYTLNSDHSTIKDADYYEDGSSIVTKKFTYYPNTTFTNAKTNYRYIFSINANKIVSEAREYQKDTEKLVRVYSYYPNTKYGEQGTHIKYIFNINDDGSTINYADGFTNNTEKKIQTFTYYPNTKYGEQGNKINFIYSLNNDEKTINSADYYEDGSSIVTKKYTYYPNTTFANAKTNYRYIFSINVNNIISEAREYVQGSEKLVRVYSYYPNTKYGQHATHIKYIFNINDDGSTINYADGFTNNAGKKIQTFTYYPNTKYGEQGNKINYIYSLNNDQKTINSADYYENGASSVSKKYTYYPNTKLSNAQTNYKYVFSVNANNIISEAREYLQGNEKLVRVYSYYPNTKYGQHATHIKYIFNINGDGSTINYADGFANNTGKKIQTFDYYPNTKYGTQSSHIRYIHSLNSNGSIKNTQVLENLTQKTTNWIEYFSNTYYGNQMKKTRFVFNVDDDGYLTDAYEYNTSGKKIYQYIYSPKTIYGQNHGNRIVQIIPL